MDIRFPDVGRLGLGVGIDLPWGQPVGFGHVAGQGDRVSPRVQRFLERKVDHFGYFFASWQPRGRNRLTVDDYAPAWDSLFSGLSGYPVRALHHTALNLGAAPGYDRRELLDWTNAFIKRYRLAWVNEDLGLWSLGGKPLPYPLPPFLTDAGLEATVANIDECQKRLAAPLLVEFPGFSSGVSLVVGPWDAYDFFRESVVRTGSPATLDVGHLLSWRWLKGHRGEALYAELDRLPLDHCFELHMSGCAIDGASFIDAHHGVLLAEQFELLRRLIPKCRNLKAIAYEDPRVDDDGELTPETQASFTALSAEVERWMHP